MGALISSGGGVGAILFGFLSNKMRGGERYYILMVLTQLNCLPSTSKDVGMPEKSYVLDFGTYRKAMKYAR